MVFANMFGYCFLFVSKLYNISIRFRRGAIITWHFLSLKLVSYLYSCNHWGKYIIIFRIISIYTKWTFLFVGIVYYNWRCNFILYRIHL